VRVAADNLLINSVATCVPSTQKQEGPQGGMLAALLENQFSLRTLYPVWFFAATSFQRPKNPVRVRQFSRSETPFLTRLTSRVFLPGHGPLLRCGVGWAEASPKGATYVRECSCSPLDGHNAVRPSDSARSKWHIAIQTQNKGLSNFSPYTGGMEMMAVRESL
jgi:hypothetical protein